MSLHNIRTDMRSYSQLQGNNSKEEKEARKIMRNKFNYSEIGI
jgi:hypothetical protein